MGKSNSLFRGIYEGFTISILGAFVGWVIWGLFTNDFETDSLLLLIFGIFIGHSIEKNESSST